MTYISLSNVYYQYIHVDNQNKIYISILYLLFHYDLKTIE